VADPAVLDFHLVQCGHGDLRTAIHAAGHAAECAGRPELQPVVNGEVCYEGIMGSAHEDVQRFLFWSSMLSGIRGYTYGANGIWQLNGDDVPYGPSPHGGVWGDTPWRQAARLPGARQIALGKALLEEYSWWEMDPHPEWVTPSEPEGEYMRPYAAGIPGRLRIVYFPQPLVHWQPRKQIVGLEQGVAYEALFFDPATGRRWEAGRVEPGPDGTWPIPTPPLMQDMVLVLEGTK
jgi:hypothetical protein